jgi:FtsP/CotA-like multicopper oxidase with cupredoxin domain
MLSLLANNSFPGPTLTAHAGDTIQVTILNNFIKDDVTMVFGGLQLVKAPPGPIIPQGGVGSYTLSAPHAGNFGWHAALSLQTASGLWGSLLVTNTTYTAPNQELSVFLADARAAPNLCYDGSGKWDALSCPMASAQKATLNGQWGDGSKESPKPVIQVKSDVCYTLKMLAVSMQPDSMFEFSIKDHHFSLPDGQRNLPILKVVPDAGKGMEATFCANQHPVLDHDYPITYSLFNNSEPTQKTDFAGILRYQ